MLILDRSNHLRRMILRVNAEMTDRRLQHFDVDLVVRRQLRISTDQSDFRPEIDEAA